MRAMSKVSIHEVRRLILPIETVVDAVLLFDRDRAGALVHATIVEAKVASADDEPGLVLMVRSSGSETVESRRIALPAVAAAIIHYCWIARIPLPRHGAKTLEIVPEGFAFSIESTLQLPRRHDPSPVQRRDAIAAGKVGSAPVRQPPPAAPQPNIQPDMNTAP